MLKSCKFSVYTGFIPGFGTQAISTKALEKAYVAVLPRLISETESDWYSTSVNSDRCADAWGVSKGRVH